MLWCALILVCLLLLIAIIWMDIQSIKEPFTCSTPPTSAPPETTTTVSMVSGTVDATPPSMFMLPSDSTTTYTTLVGNKFTFRFQTDGNLVISDNTLNTPTFSSQTFNNQNSKLSMQADGNLVIYNKDNQAIWNADKHTSGTHMTFDGNTGQVDYVDSSKISEFMLPTNVIVNPFTYVGKNHTLKFQPDGNLVVYNNASNAATWYSGTDGHPGSKLFMQADGNLVIYDKDNKALWASNTHISGTHLKFDGLSGMLYMVSGASGGVITTMLNNTIVSLPSFSTPNNLGSTIMGGGPGQFKLAFTQGALTISDPDGRDVWHTPTKNIGSSMVMKDNGDIIIYGNKPDTSNIAWSNIGPSGSRQDKVSYNFAVATGTLSITTAAVPTTLVDAYPRTLNNCLAYGDAHNGNYPLFGMKLSPTQDITISRNGSTLQYKNGAINILDKNGDAVFTTGTTNGSNYWEVAVQDDRNLVIYVKGGAVWSSKTDGTWAIPYFNSIKASIDFVENNVVVKRLGGYTTPTGDYVKIDATDAPLNDITQVAGSPTADTLKGKCNDLINCLGFNLGGYLKSDVSKLQDSAANTTYVKALRTRYPYKLYKDKNSPGNDIKHMEGATPEQTRAMCDMEPGCKGYNPDGWIKSAIGPLQDAPGIDIYVKDASAPTYTMYVDKDNAGNDIRQVKTSDVQEMVAQCEADPACKGFNTGGYLKSVVNATTLTPNPGNTMYIKDPRPATELGLKNYSYTFSN